MLALAAILLGTTTGLRADVKLQPIFGDHMVLQEGIKLPVWGTAAPGEAVTVTVGKETAHATADGSGNWRVDLPALPAGGAPVTMTVAGKNTLTFTDVLVGDVWICSGQSNMEFGIQNDAHGTETIAQANEPEIRLFMVAKKTALQPQVNLPPASGLTGTWQVCTPAALGGKWGWNGFSAAGYYFAHNLHENLHKPIGMIGTYWGGTPAQAWTSISGLEKDPALKHYVDAHDALVTNLAAATAEYPAKIDAYKVAVKAWEDAGGKAFEDQMTAWNTAAKQATAAGQAPPPKPITATPKPRGPTPPDGGSGAPASLYNAMVAPLVSFGIKGAIWYQGEANAGAAAEYGTLFPSMITDWREKWGQGNFPFLFVQLASFKAGATQNWPFLREAQARALELPETGMATAVDIGDPNNIHPADKLDVGKRLALIAKQVAYGENLVDSGPVYKSMQTQGGAIHVSFTEEAGGLVIGQAPWTAPGNTPPPTDHLTGFTIAGADQKFVPADAKIDGTKVTVSSPQVTSPAAVRYDWANAPDGNLYNKDSLPADPFRTDDWPDPVAQGLGKPASKAPSTPTAK